MVENFVKEKLRTAIIPKIVVSEKLKKKNFYRIHLFYSYVNDIVAILIGAGIISSDFLGLFTESKTTTIHPQTSLPLILIIGIIFWALLKTYVQRENTQKRFELARSYQQKFNKFESRLPLILEENNPMKNLVDLHLNMINVVDAAIADDVWEVNQEKKYQTEIDDRVNQLCRDYERYWVGIPLEGEMIEK